MNFPPRFPIGTWLNWSRDGDWKGIGVALIIAVKFLESRAPCPGNINRYWRVGEGLIVNVATSIAVAKSWLNVTSRMVYRFVVVSPLRLAIRASSGFRSPLVAYFFPFLWFLRLLALFFILRGWLILSETKRFYLEREIALIVAKSWLYSCKSEKGIAMENKIITWLIAKLKGWYV